ncbi:MAG: hypothetical protein ACOYNY_25900 [Caldilineaceae bacterium]
MATAIGKQAICWMRQGSGGARYRRRTSVSMCVLPGQAAAPIEQAFVTALATAHPGGSANAGQLLGEALRRQRQGMTPSLRLC